MVMGIDQPGQKQVVTQIDDAIGACRQFARRADRLNHVILDKNRAVVDLGVGIIEGRDTRRVGQQLPWRSSIYGGSVVSGIGLCGQEVERQRRECRDADRQYARPRRKAAND